MPVRPYEFFELTNSLCSKCLDKIEAKVIFENSNVYLQKFCPEHGREKVIIGTDIDYYKQCRSILKPSQMPLKFNTEIEKGCPFDCGLCSDHEQHSCLSLLEITDKCNLTCPICYAASSPSQPHRTLKEVEMMLDCIVENEGEPDVVQISGGEPTIHPDFFDILAMAKSRPIKHLMINTNGITIAKDKAFVERLAQHKPGLEIYLQFDSLKANALVDLRGANLLDIRQQALANLEEAGLSTTLVVTLKKGLNDDEIGAIIEHALSYKCVRGVTFQPVQQAGRVENFDPALDRFTLSEVRQSIADQSPHFTLNDILPVPCHPDCVAMAYGLKDQDTLTPFTEWVDPERKGNVIDYERKLHDLSLSHNAKDIASLLCCLPKLPVPSELSYENIFRITIIQFLDAYNFDVRSVKKSCIHIASPKGKMIPFDTYNLFYREGVSNACEQ